VLSAAHLLGLAAGTHLRHLRAQKDALTLLHARLEEAELRARLAWETAELLRDRFAKIPDRHRPHFTPAQRFRVLEIRSLLAWNARETARLFLLSTIPSSTGRRPPTPTDPTPESSAPPCGLSLLSAVPPTSFARPPSS